MYYVLVAEDDGSFVWVSEFASLEAARKDAELIARTNGKTVIIAERRTSVMTQTTVVWGY